MNLCVSISAQSDFNEPNSQPIFILPTSVPEVDFSANGDSISQEGVETFTLVLSLTPGFAVDSDAFFRNELLVSITDGTSKCRVCLAYR